jgi:outer membrane protein assembly factor BamB
MKPNFARSMVGALPCIPCAALAFTVFASGISTGSLCGASADRNEGGEGAWGQWRGPLANGVAPKANPPIEWGENKNVRWKLAIPGKGHATPVVWGNFIYLNTAVPHGPEKPPVYDQAPGTHDNLPVMQDHQFMVVAVDRRTGTIAWSRTVRDEFPHEGGHVTGSLASISPATDGEYVYASFGSHGLYCFDLTGKLVWQRDLGRMNTLHAHGEGSSPVIEGDSLILNWDHEGDSVLYCFDKRTGKDRWKVNRDDKTSWSTPIIVEHHGRKQVVISATKRVRGYDLADGSLLWECGGLSRNVVSSPVAGNGMVFAGNSYDWQAMLAIRLEGAKGDITETDRVAWRMNRLTPYVSSPLLYGSTLYFLRHNQNILSRVEASNGKPRGEPLRLEGVTEIFASPMGAAGRIYITSRNGTTLVLGHSETGNNPTLAINRLDDVFTASPVAVDRELILRGEKYLYCLGN